MAPNPEQVRTRLRAISILLFLLAISSLALLGWREVRVRQDVFASILEDRARSSAREFGGFFGPVQQQLAVIRSWGSPGIWLWRIRPHWMRASFRSWTTWAGQSRFPSWAATESSTS